jgi:hypothetical protein
VIVFDFDEKNAIPVIGLLVATTILGGLVLGYLLDQRNEGFVQRCVEAGVPDFVCREVARKRN